VAVGIVAVYVQTDVKIVVGHITRDGLHSHQNNIGSVVPESSYLISFRGIIINRIEIIAPLVNHSQLSGIAGIRHRIIMRLEITYMRCG